MKPLDKEISEIAAAHSSNVDSNHDGVEGWGGGGGEGRGAATKESGGKRKGEWTFT